ncbi:MAG: hypothetical protein NZ843_00195 [Fimbriimonadales bacterium]|nr:hypothetical protein [Fimbriimonadales bacterium]
MCREAAAVFLQRLRQIVPQIEAALNAPTGDWAALGVIDFRHTVYPLSQDTKLASKIIELMILPKLNDFSNKHQYKLEIAPEQNYYPDATFIDSAGCKFALDIKTTYRVRGKADKVSAMTLGTFMGYFRDRNSIKNIRYPYNEYSGHFVLGVIYTRNQGIPQISHPQPLQNIGSIPRVIRDIKVFVEYKYKIASDRPGSGNTKNIGSVRQVKQLLTGSGPFEPHGEEVFDDYWMNYQTREMAKGKQPPYTNLQEYFEWKERGE